MILLYMASNNVAKSSNSIFVILISLFVILFIIISYFMLTGNMIDVDGSQTESVNGANNNNNSNNNNNNNVQREKEVYNIRDNMFTYNEARAVCAAHDAKLASLEEMIEAYNAFRNQFNVTVNNRLDTELIFDD